MKSKRLADGLKEFDPNMRIGFSPDDINYRDADFEAVRGTPQNHPQLNAIHELLSCYGQAEGPAGIKTIYNGRT